MSGTLKECSRCAKKSRSNTFLYHGRVFGPTCHVILMESVTWRSSLPMVREQNCHQCGNTFLAPNNIPCIDRCCACCKSQNPGYENHPCIKNTVEGRSYQIPPVTSQSTI